MNKYLLFTLTLIIALLGFQGQPRAHGSVKLAYDHSPQPRHPNHFPHEIRAVIPSDLKKQLKDEFGDFRVATSRDYCPNLRKNIGTLRPSIAWSYGAINEDFNGDGSMDYSVIIRLTETNRYIWLLAVKKHSMGKPYLFTNLGWPSIKHFLHSSRMLTGKMCEGVLLMGQAHSLTADNPHPYLGLGSPPSGVLLYRKDGFFFQTGYRPYYLTELQKWQY